MKQFTIKINTKNVKPLLEILDTNDYTIIYTDDTLTTIKFEYITSYEYDMLKRTFKEIQIY